MWNTWTEMWSLWAKAGSSGINIPFCPVLFTSCNNLSKDHVEGWAPALAAELREVILPQLWNSSHLFFLCPPFILKTETIRHLIQQIFQRDYQGGFFTGWWRGSFHLRKICRCEKNHLHHFFGSTRPKSLRNCTICNPQNPNSSGIW